MWTPDAPEDEDEIVEIENHEKRDILENLQSWTSFLDVSTPDDRVLSCNIIRRDISEYSRTRPNTRARFFTVVIFSLNL